MNPLAEQEEREWVDSEEAATLMDVAKRTIYNYVSKGYIKRCVVDGTTMYSLSDIMRMKARSDARRGHRAVASEALHWGEPVLDTSISCIEYGKLYYRGQRLEEVLDACLTFEATADLILGDEGEGLWPEINQGMEKPALLSLVALTDIIPKLLLVEEQLALQAYDKKHIARAFIQILCVALCGNGQGSIAARLAARTPGGGPRAQARARQTLDLALSTCAEHGLSASTFAARTAASAGASIGACLATALCVLSGVRHGGAARDIEAALRDADGTRNATYLPGFHHPLYPSGDPRAKLLIAEARRYREKPKVQEYIELAERVEKERGLYPNIDFGLFLIQTALELPDGASLALFALGRSAGWLAHIEEQRLSEVILRPKARYVGP